MVEKIPLTNMDAGEAGRIVEILGGHGVLNRLSSMGIRRGVIVKRIGAAFGRGPVVIQTGGTQTALGHGMSYRVIVEVER